MLRTPNRKTSSAGSVSCGIRDPKILLDAQTWLAASGQIFFSLSVGFGIIVNYASYLRRQDDVVLRRVDLQQYERVLRGLPGRF